jgi:hypothetical protein
MNKTVVVRAVVSTAAPGAYGLDSEQPDVRIATT